MANAPYPTYTPRPATTNMVEIHERHIAIRNDLDPKCPLCRIIGGVA